VLGAEGAVTLIERLSPALGHVDSSSGAIGSAVYVEKDSARSTKGSAESWPSTQATRPS
jgi:hypothetical protein